MTQTVTKFTIQQPETLHMLAKNRILLISAAFLCLGLSCSDVETYRIETASAEQVVTVVAEWADLSGFKLIECAQYNLNRALEDSCHEIGGPERVPQYLVAAESGKEARTVIVWISFGGVSESERSGMLRSLGEALTVQFQPENVALEE